MFCEPKAQPMLVDAVENSMLYKVSCHSITLGESKELFHEQLRADQLYRGCCCGC